MLVDAEFFTIDSFLDLSGGGGFRGVSIVLVGDEGLIAEETIVGCYGKHQLRYGEGNKLAG